MGNLENHTGNERQPTSRRPVAIGCCVVAASVLGLGLVASAADPVQQDAGTSSQTAGMTSQATAMTDAGSEVFAGISPVRLLDTRSGVGAPNPGPFGPGETRTVIAAGFGGVPADATGIAINVTLPRSASTSSFVTVWPSGSPQPVTSTSNATPGQAVPNSAVTALGSDGGINIFNEQGDTHIVVDIVGYYVSTDSVDIPGGVLYTGSGAPSDSMGMDGDFYIDDVETDMYMKESARWGEPMIEIATKSNDPHVIADDGPPSSSDGIDGDVYLDTAALEVYGPKVRGSWGAGQSIGAGGDGSAFLSGAGAPAASLGANGDLYLNTQNPTLFGPKASGSWGAGTPVGPDGVGATFLSGAGTPSAGLGSNGDLYLDSTNAVVFGPKASGSWGVGVDVGPDGVGSTLRTGPGSPSDADDGVDGDTYIDLTSLNFYGPKTDGSWGSPLSLRGADGADGTDGVDGTDGTNGVDGIDGADGTNGVDGVDGADGATILSGSSAPSDADDGVIGDLYLNTATSELFGPKTSAGWGTSVSLRGTDGADGVDGVDGTNGVDGVDGATIRSGDGEPVDGTFNDGDIYIDLVTGVLHGPRATDGTWTTLIDLDSAPTAATDSALSASGSSGTVSVGLTAGVDTEIPFDTQGVSVGTSLVHDDTDDSIRFTEAGVYKISYAVEDDATLSLAGAIELRVGGVIVDSTSSLLAAGLPTTRVILVEAATDDTLELWATGLLGVTLGTDVNFESSIVIELIAVD